MMQQMMRNNRQSLSCHHALKQKRLVPREALYEDEACTVPSRSFRWFVADVPQDVAIVKEWRRWMREVIMPNNDAIVDLILVCAASAESRAARATRSPALRAAE